MAKKAGGLFKRANRPDWQADFQYKGVRVSCGTGCTSRTEAEKWKQERKRQIDQNLEASRLSINTRLTLKQAAAKYWDEQLQFSAGADTSEKYRLASVVQGIGPNTRLEDLSTADVKKYVALKMSEELAKSTIGRHIGTMRALVNHALDIWEYPVKAIAWKRISPRVPKVEPIKISISQAQTLIAAASERAKPIIQFALLTGMRRDEIRRLRWSMIDFNAGEMEIINPDGTRTTLRLASVRFKGKGGKVASIPLNSEAVSLLSSLQQNKSQAVFDFTNFRKEWDAVRMKAGLQHITFHTLRHAHATILDQMNAPIQGIKRLLRHSDISTTLIYANADVRAALPYLERLGTMLSASQQQNSEGELTPELKKKTQ